MSSLRWLAAPLAAFGLLVAVMYGETPGQTPLGQGGLVMLHVLDHPRHHAQRRDVLGHLEGQTENKEMNARDRTLYIIEKIIHIFK